MYAYIDLMNFFEIIPNFYFVDFVFFFCFDKFMSGKLPNQTASHYLYYKLFFKEI